MSVYEEKTLKWYWALLLITVSFFIMYSPFQLGERDLYWSEGDYGSMATEINSFPPMPLAHGEIIPNTYPLYPLVVSFFYNSGFGMEFSLRIVSVLALAAIVLVVWETARRAMDVQAASVAAVAAMTTVLMAEKTLDGYPNMLALFMLTCGWLTWYSFGAGRGEWDLAWVSGFFFCGLAFYTTGWEAVIYFITPLIFMRRPLTIWRKMKSGFFTGLAILLVFILLWGIPRWKAGADIPFRSLPIEPISLLSYIGQLFVYPFEVLVRFMPWVLLAWAPLCVAFHPLDKNPIFSRFLRTIFISLFFLLWFMPSTKGRDLMVLVPPMAIMIGMNYWLAVRRYGNLIRTIMTYFSIVLICAGAGALLLYLIPAETIHEVVPLKRELFYKSQPGYLTAGLIQAAGSLLAGILLVTYFKKFGRIWTMILVFSLGSMLFYWSVLNPYKAQEHSRSAFGHLLKESLGKEYHPELTVYKDRKISGLYTECIYMGCKVKKIKSISELPENIPTVFLISTEVPSATNRAWKNILPERTFYKEKRIYLWKGVKIDKSKENEYDGI